MLRTTVRDCLYLNWAFPAEALPPPPSPLRYQRHVWQGRDYVFASALLFHQDSLHLTALPSLKFGYPQLTVRLYVLDDEGVPSVLFRRMLMPGWVAPGVRLITHQPAARARLRFPRPSQQRRRSVGLERRASQGPAGGAGVARLAAGRRGAAPRLVGGVGPVFPGAPPRVCPGLREAAADLGRSPRGRDLADAGGGRGGFPAAATARPGAGNPLARAPLGLALPGDPVRLRARAGAADSGRCRHHAAAGGGTGGEFLRPPGGEADPHGTAAGLVLASRA